MTDSILLAGTKFLGSTFLKQYIADNQLTTDADLAKAKELYKNELTLNIMFDFENVTEDEMRKQLVSTTSYAKMLYNNELVMLNEQECKDLCLQGTYECKIRNMLDTRKTKTADPETGIKKNIAKMQAKGMTQEQIKESLLKQIELLS